MTNNSNPPIKAFAIVVDNEVAYVLNFIDGGPFEGIVAALASNPQVVRRPEIVNIEDKGPMAFFDLYVDDELGPNLGYRTDHANAEAIIAGLSSNPTIIQVPFGLTIGSGWTWNGTNFTAPQ